MASGRRGNGDRPWKRRWTPRDALVVAGVLTTGLAALGVVAEPASSPETVREILRRRCFECHGADGNAAKGVDVLDHARLIGTGVVRAKDRKSPLLRAVEDGSMPLGGDPLPASELARLRDWIDAGAPGWQLPGKRAEPGDGRWLSEKAVWDIVAADLLRVAEPERRHLRYFSLATLLNAGASSGEVEGYRQGLSRLLNSLSWEPKVVNPRSADAGGAVLRIDLRDYGWDAGTWKEVVAHYPYGVESAAVRRVEALAGAELPCLRGDWFAAAASVPPLYHRILDLPDTVSELEARLDADTISTGKSVRGGFTRSGVSRHNRVVERFPTRYGAYWKSHDFASSGGDANVLLHPLSFRADGGEMIFSLPNGLQGYFVADARGRRLERAPVEIVSDRNDVKDPRVVNGRSCMRCHAGGMKPFRDDIRPLAERRTETDLERQRLLALYPPQAELERLLQTDVERFRRAAEKAGGSVSPDFRSEPISKLAARFEADVTLAAAAAEVGWTPEAFRSGVTSHPRLEKLGVGRLLRGDTLKREDWETLIVETRVELGAGEPYGAATGPRGGVLIVAADDWLLRGENGDQFTHNLASYLTRGRAGRLLIYSKHPAFGASFQSALARAGHRAEQTLEPGPLSEYDAVFTGGDAEADPEAIAGYVRAGGKVFLAAGTGDIPGESTFWNGMLAHFGLRLSRPGAVRRASIRQFEASPLFRNLPALAGRSPMPVSLLLGDGRARILVAEHGINWLAECRISEPIKAED